MAQNNLAFQSFGGVDLHKTTVTLAAVEPTGRTIGRLTCPTKCVDKIDAWLDALPAPVHLAVEACPFVEWFIDRYRRRVEVGGGRMDIADATQLESLRGKRRKNDVNDATDIARRLARGECPLGWIADEATMSRRKLGRQWHRLSRTLSRTKASMRSILNAANLRGPSKLDGVSAQKWLLAHGHELLRDADRDSFADLLGLVQTIERLRAPLKLKLIAANREPDVAAMIELLTSVRGVNQITAALIAAEVGDFARFPNADALEFYAGLTPDNKASAGRTVSGHITKAGSKTLRWALGRAAMCLCRSDARWAAAKGRLIRRGKKNAVANVAMTRRLLRTIFAMMRDGTTFQPGPSTHHTAKANRARQQKQQRRHDPEIAAL